MPLSYAPIAFKGPSDHLSQYFDDKTLYDGLLLLLSSIPLSAIHDRQSSQFIIWNYEKGDGFTQVEIKNQKVSKIKANLQWPLNNDSLQCDCGSNMPCEHISALAIETKSDIDRLPLSLKEAQSCEPNWIRLKQWAKTQKHDPYPRMARHRIIYLIDIINNECHLSVHKAYLSKSNQYQRKAEFEFIVTSSIGLKNKQVGKQPKFVSLSDEQIFQEIHQLIDAKEVSIIDRYKVVFRENIGNELINLIASTERLFWKACFRPPIQVQIASTIEHPDECFSFGNNFFLSPQKNALIKSTIYENSLEVDFSKNSKQMNTAPIRPRLTIESRIINLDFDTSTYRLDCLRLDYKIGEHWYNLDAIIDNESLLDSQSLKQIAGCNQHLDWLPTITNEYPLPISSHFNTGDRVLPADLSNWFPLIRVLQLKGWNIEISKSFRLNHLHSNDWYLAIDKQKSQTDNLESYAKWFELELGVTIGDKSINLLPYLVQEFHRAQGDYQTLENNISANKEQFSIKLDSGENLLIEKNRAMRIYSILVELSDKKSLNNNQKLQLPYNQVARLAEFEQTNIENQYRWLDTNNLREKAKAITKHDTINPISLPSSLNAQLRNYQLEGLYWLQFLSTHHLHGILADDMGLGKTLQTLAHISLEKELGRMCSPCLIVVPTSLLSNWENEVKKFAPKLKMLLLTGSKRHSLFERLSEFDLLITSYGSLAKDINKLQKHEFHLLVLDEAQAIKNSKSKISTHVSRINSHSRLCLTGTPMENHLGELWSLFDFLMPNFLGTYPQFKRIYQEPIEKNQDHQRQKHLAQRISPFMLRRTKDLVAKELPEKVIINEFIKLEPEQAELYETIRLSISEEIQLMHANPNGKKHGLTITNGLLRLRQICCHPKLLPYATSQNINASAKINWLSTVLPSMVEEGRKILIFSSFTSMLNIISATLEAMSISYLTLTGKSRNRGQLVDMFQTQETPVFLISLKAGGAGLNLTAADTVIHVDPWWNPAAEQQASDRAHRIGQNKTVFIYKLISENTVEQRIHLMQKNKSDIAKNLYQATPNQSNLLNELDWIELLQPLAEDI